MEVFGKAFVLGVSAVEADQDFQLGREFVGQFAQVGASPFPFQALIASGECLLQQRDDFTRELDGSARREKMGRITTSHYTFYLDPTKQPLGSRTFAFTW